MAAVIAQTQGSSAGNQSSYAPALPAHSAGDVLVLCAVNNGGQSTIAGFTGWTEPGTQSRNGSHRAVLLVKEASSSSETVTLTGDNDGWSHIAYTVADVDIAAIINAFGQYDDSADLRRAVCPDVLTTSDNALVLRFATFDSVDVFDTDALHGTYTESVNELGETRLISTRQVQLTAGQTGTQTWRIDQNNTGTRDSTAFTLALSNAVGGEIERNLSTQSVLLDPFGSVPEVDAVVYQDASATVSTINGETVETVTVSNDQADGAGDYILAQFDLAGVTAATNVWYGVAAAHSVDVSSGLLSITYTHRNSPSFSTDSMFIMLRDSLGNFAVYETPEPSAAIDQTDQTYVFSPSSESKYFETATPVDLTDVSSTLFLYRKTGTTTTEREIELKHYYKLGKVTATGGSAARPLSFNWIAQQLNPQGVPNRAAVVGTDLSAIYNALQIGNGSTPTYFNNSISAASWRTSAGTTFFRPGVNNLPLVINSGPNDSYIYDSSLISATDVQSMTFSGVTPTLISTSSATIKGVDLTLSTDLPQTLAAFIECNKISSAGCPLDRCTIRDSRATDATIAITENTTHTGCTYSADSSVDYNIELGQAVTNFTINGPTFTGSAAINKIHVLATSGTVTIQNDGGLIASDITSEGATVDLIAPTLARTINVTETADIYIFDGDTQTILASATGTTQLIYEYSGAPTVREIVLKAGRLPIRSELITYGANSTNTTYTPQNDPVYLAAHGLIYPTDVSYDTVNELITIPTFGPTVQQIHSALIDARVSGAVPRNTRDPIEMNGPLQMFLTGGAEFAAGSVGNVVGGVRYVAAGGAVAAQWLTLRSVGDIDSAVLGEYQQTAGGAVTDARTTGHFNQTIQIFGDASHGNFDRRSHLVAKLQRNGYAQARADVLALAGVSELDNTVYIVPLNMAALVAATGDPGVTLTLVDHTAAPITVGGQVFSYELQVPVGVSAIDALRQFNFDQAGDAALFGSDPFNWPNWLIEGGAGIETARGVVEGGGTFGLYVSQNGADHPEIVRFQADNGNYYTPAPVNIISGSDIVAGSRLRVVNETQAPGASAINTVVTGTTFSDTYAGTSAYAPGDVLTVYLASNNAGVYQEPWSTTVIVGSGGWSFLASQVPFTAANSWNIDGATVTEFSADNTNIDIDINDPDGQTLKVRLAAWWLNELTTATGIENFWGAFSIPAANVIRQEVDVVDVLLHSVGGPVRFTDNDVRYYRSDGSDPYDNTGASIFMDYTGVPDVVTVSTGSGLSTEQDAILRATATEITLQSVATDVLALGAGQTAIASSVNNLNDISAADVTAAVPTAVAIAAEVGAPSISEIQAIVPTSAANADALLARNHEGGADGGRTVSQALASNRNRVIQNVEAGTMTVYESDDLTVSWAATIVTDVDGNVTEINPL